MFKKLLAISILSGILILGGCTENQRAKQLGGTMNVDLPQGKKLVTATWKEDEFWYLTRDMRSDEQAEIYEFIEDSNFGIMEGKVIIKESK